jgi:O-antigen/teichoic acid export membrane protein
VSEERQAPPAAGADDAAPVPGTVGVARGTTYGLLSDAATIVSALAVAIIIARFLGPEKRGIYFLAVLTAALIAIVADAGVSTSGLVFAANRRVARRQLHGAAAAIALTATLVSAVVLIGLAPWLTDTVLKGLDRTILWLVVAGILLTVYSQVVSSMLTGLGRIPMLSLIRTIGAIAAPVFLVPVVLAGADTPEWALVAWLAALVVLAGGMAVDAFRHLGRPALPGRHELGALLGFGLRAHLGTMSHHGFLRIDVLFISARLGPADVGQYSLASVLAERISLVGSALYGASASRVGGGDRAAATALVTSMIRILALLLVPAAVILALLAEPLIVLAFGSEFEPAVTPFILLLPGTVCLTVWYVLGLYIIAALHQPGRTTIIQGAALLVSLPLYYLAVRAWGMNGAAIVSSGVYGAVMLAGLWIFLHRTSCGLRALVPGPGDVRRAWGLARRALGRPATQTTHA